MPLDSQGRLPNIELAMVEVLKPRLIRAKHVGTDQGKGSQKLPNVVVERDGGLPFTDLTRLDRARIMCFSRARTREEAILMSNDVRRAFIPTDTVVGGLKAVVRYTDPNTGELITTDIMWAREDGSPVYLPDGRGIPMVRESFMVTYS